MAILARGAIPYRYGRREPVPREGHGRQECLPHETRLLDPALHGVRIAPLTRGVPRGLSLCAKE
jgi:hypothetical protein